MRKTALVIAFLLAFATGTGTANAAEDKLIDVGGKGEVRSFGLFNPNADPSPTAAAAGFGQGSILNASDNSCLIHYFPAGVGILFANFGAPGATPCDPSVFKAQKLSASGPGWRTNRGLAIGDGLKKLKKLYRERRRGKAKWVLTDKKSLIGTSGRQDVLWALVADRRVFALEVWAGKAGD